MLLLRRVLRAHALAAPPAAAAAAAAHAAAADVEGTVSRGHSFTAPGRTALASQLASLFAEAMLRPPPRAGSPHPKRFASP